MVLSVADKPQCPPVLFVTVNFRSEPLINALRGIPGDHHDKMLAAPS